MEKRKGALQPAGEPAFSLIRQAAWGHYRCQKQLSGLMPCCCWCFYRFCFARYIHNVILVWLGNSVRTVLRNKVFVLKWYSILKQPPRKGWWVWKSREAPRLFVFTAYMNPFSPEKVGCCEHDLQLHGFKVFWLLLHFLWRLNAYCVKMALGLQP